MAAPFRLELRRPVATALAVTAGAFLLATSLTAVRRVVERRRGKQPLANAAEIVAGDEFGSPGTISATLISPGNKIAVVEQQGRETDQQVQDQLATCEFETGTGLVGVGETTEESQRRSARPNRPYTAASSAIDAVQLHEEGALPNGSEHSADGVEIRNEMADFAGSNLEHAGGGVSAFIATACAALDMVQTSTRAPSLPAAALFSRGLELSRQNIASACDLAQKLVRAGDVQEAMQLQAEYAAAQIAALQMQAKQLAGIAGKRPLLQGAAASPSGGQQGEGVDRQAKTGR